ncbi:MAG: hypothetical protein WD749_12135, partial [Phycisphaerales bacterium]
PDPDLLPVLITESWRESVRARLPELPPARIRRYTAEYGLGPREAAALVEERDVCLFYEAAVSALRALGVPGPRAGKAAANLILQSGAKRANERGVLAHELGIAPSEVAQIARLREDGAIGSNAADELFGLLCEPPEPVGQASRLPAAGTAAQHPRDAESLARARGLLAMRDAAAMDAWIDNVLAANDTAAADVRAGKLAAAGRLVGEVMKLSGGQADAKAVRERILAKLGVG